jgi:HEPN domain
MLLVSELHQISQARLHDAQALLEAGRLDGAVYLCGYAIELALKARICKTLNGLGYPETNKEFEKLSSFKVHELSTLLRLTGVEAQVKSTHFLEWRTVIEWNPELRYKPIGSTSMMTAQAMLDSASVLLKIL